MQSRVKYEAHTLRPFPSSQGEKLVKCTSASELHCLPHGKERIVQHMQLLVNLTGRKCEQYSQMGLGNGTNMLLCRNRSSTKRWASGNAALCQHRRSPFS